MTDAELMDAQTAARELMAEAAEAERLRAEVRLLRESVADHRRELTRLRRVEEAARAFIDNEEPSHDDALWLALEFAVHSLSATLRDPP
jgi:hypothetical protein